jgi:hypothetical protein
VARTHAADCRLEARDFDGENLGFAAAARRATREAIRKVARIGGCNPRSSGAAMNWITDIRTWPFRSQQAPHLRGKFFACLSSIVQVDFAGIYA